MSAHGAPRPEEETRGRILDDEHLAHMTLGDRRLEREVLEIFVRQSADTLALILDCIGSRDPAGTAAASHAMIGSARAIGAWRVAQAAERLERAAGTRSEQELEEAIVALRAASLEADAAIGARLADPAKRTADCA